MRSSYFFPTSVLNIFTENLQKQRNWQYLMRYSRAASYITVINTVIRFFHLVNFCAKNLHEIISVQIELFKEFTLYNYIRKTNFCAFSAHENIFTTKKTNYGSSNFNISRVLVNAHYSYMSKSSVSGPRKWTKRTGTNPLFYSLLNNFIQLQSVQLLIKWPWTVLIVISFTDPVRIKETSTGLSKFRLSKQACLVHVLQ